MVTISDIQNMKNAFREMAVMFVDLSVTLVDTGSVISVTGHIGIRGTSGVIQNSRSIGLTGGADQDTYVCVLDYDAWTAASPGRPPKKGDVVDNAGMVYAIQRVVLANPAGTGMFYKAQLLG